jgi:hypothetical protein
MDNGFGKNIPVDVCDGRRLLSNAAALGREPVCALPADLRARARTVAAERNRVAVCVDCFDARSAGFHRGDVVSLPPRAYDQLRMFWSGGAGWAIDANSRRTHVPAFIPRRHDRCLPSSPRTEADFGSRSFRRASARCIDPNHNRLPAERSRHRCDIALSEPSSTESISSGKGDKGIGGGRPSRQWIRSWRELCRAGNARG